jgi:hypothetical protein
MLKQSYYRHGQALRVPGGRGSQIPRQSAHEGDKVVRPTIYYFHTLIVRQGFKDNNEISTQQRV